MAKRKRKITTRRAALLPERRVARRKLTILTVLPSGKLKLITALARTSPKPVAKRSLPRLLSTIPEKRTYHPAGKARPVTTLSGTEGPGLKPGLKLYRLTFKQPQTITICRRRQIRKQVMFAIGKGGSKGLGLRKRRRLNDDSKITC